ncbi:MAG: hypothetical protein GX093_05680 [Xanthomonadaceae bacterium]|nr:hypothetical protein [Xanthomonadaceae bacterium]
MPRRQNSTTDFPFRSGRFFYVNGEWYFASRESSGHGPYIDRAAAEAACRRYVEAKQRANRLRRSS